MHLACWTQLWNLRHSGNAKILWCIDSSDASLSHPSSSYLTPWVISYVLVSDKYFLGTLAFPNVDDFSENFQRREGGSFLAGRKYIMTAMLFKIYEYIFYKVYFPNRTCNMNFAAWILSHEFCNLVCLISINIVVFCQGDLASVRGLPGRRREALSLRM